MISECSSDHCRTISSRSGTLEPVTSVNFTALEQNASLFLQLLFKSTPNALYALQSIAVWTKARMLMLESWTLFQHRATACLPL